MKKFFITILAMVFLVPVVLFAADLSVTLNVNKGSEVDIQEYKLYTGQSEQEVIDKMNPATLIASGTPDTIPDVISYGYTAQVPDSSEGSIYFGVTATDTSGNESGMSNIASKSWDFLAPAPLVISVE